MTDTRPTKEDALPNGTNSPPAANHNARKPSDQDPHLCDCCQGLGLSLDKFVIQSHDASGPPHSSQFTPKSMNTKYSLGLFSDIWEKRSTCSLCYLVAQSVNALQASLARPELLQAKCAATWEIDGRGGSRHGFIRPRTRRIRLRRDLDGLEDSHLVFMAPENHIRFNSDARNVWDKRSLYLGRTISPYGNNTVLMKSWLDGCCRGHTGQCLIERDRDFENMIRQSYFGVVDVLDMRLVALPYKVLGRWKTDLEDRFPSSESSSLSDSDRMGARDERQQSEEMLEPADFVALSYVWGPGNLKAPYTSMLENVLIHRNPGGLERCLDRLPQVVQDAIELVRRLGLRYLWVDSLCIIQNSHRSWKLNASVMDLIYSNAFLTICAADGATSDTGLKALYPTTNAIEQHTAQCTPNVRLMVSHLAESGIRLSVWNSRAWTFQERLLSRRCLIFTEGRVFFQCRATTMSEDIVAEPEGAGWSLDLVQAPPRLLRELETRPFWVYIKCVYLYSSRALTKQKDILAAFNGVSNRISKVMKAPFIFGLPSSHFDLALLWEPRSALKRRGTDFQEKRHQIEQPEFPSWSWCGWMASTIQHANGVDYRNNMVEGCLANVREWLLYHTWIRWYIRDGHGNLRPIWDGTKATENQLGDSHWRGYRVISNTEKMFDNQDIEDPGAPDAELLKYECELDERKRSRLQELDRKENNLIILNETPEQRIQGNIVSNSRRMQQHMTRQRGPERSRKHYERHRTGDAGSHVRQGRVRVVPEDNWYEAEDKSLGYNSDQRHEPRDHFDDYGRYLSQTTLYNSHRKFQRTFPENPYRVVVTDYSHEVDREFPDQPLLQFWTWSAALHVLPAIKRDEKLGAGLQRHDLADDVGDWCGSIVLDEAWAAEHVLKGRKHEFIAISEAKNFTDEECEVWTYYIPKERDQSEWDLYYVLLVEERNSMVKQRVALGKVFRAAFEITVPGQSWKEIVLG